METVADRQQARGDPGHRNQKFCERADDFERGVTPFGGTPEICGTTKTSPVAMHARLQRDAGSSETTVSQSASTNKPNHSHREQDNERVGAGWTDRTDSVSDRLGGKRRIRAAHHYPDLLLAERIGQHLTQLCLLLFPQLFFQVACIFCGTVQRLPTQNQIRAFM